MPYKYTYKDWKEGKIIWNDIISHDTDVEYISEKCIKEIEKSQRAIFNKQAKLRLHLLIKGLKLDVKGSLNNQQIIRHHLETIENLFNGPIDKFPETKVIFYTKGVPDSYSEEYTKAMIPPLMVDTFDKKDIECIRKSMMNYYENNGSWKYSVVETKEVNELIGNVDFQAEVWASAYYLFRTQLLENNDNFKNTPTFKLIKDYLRPLRNKLIDNKFIVKCNPDLFIRMFSGTYLYEEEKIIWNKSRSCLNYFISELEYFEMYTPKNLDKWEAISNCFRLTNEAYIEPESLRKAKKKEVSSDDKAKVDNIVSYLKRLSRQ